MRFVSELIGRPVIDADGERIGTLKDLIASRPGNLPHPKIVALEVKLPRGTRFIPVSDVMVLIAPNVILNQEIAKIAEYAPHPDDLYLIRDVLDKQIIDTNGVRVVRVNDLELTRIEGEIYASNVDISGAGLFRRLGMGKFSRRLAKGTPESSPQGFISWDAVELLSVDEPIRLKVPGERITELHPADLAEIVSDLSRQDGSKLLESLDLKTLADTLEEVEPEFQASLIEEMSDERVADVLEEMAPDEAADLLAQLPEQRSQDLLKLMEDDDAEDVIRLLAYPEESAGGIMNTEFFAVSPEMTADQVIALLRSSAEEAETVFYVYVTDPSGRLVGVFSLRELLLANPASLVSEFMEDRVVTVELEDSQEECAQVVSKYNLLAVPVVDVQNQLHGIVTADDALDKIIPTAWKKRLPRFYR